MHVICIYLKSNLAKFLQNLHAVYCISDYTKQDLIPKSITFMVTSPSQCPEEPRLFLLYWAGITPWIVKSHMAQTSMIPGAASISMRYHWLMYQKILISFFTVIKWMDVLSIPAWVRLLFYDILSLYTNYQYYTVCYVSGVQLVLCTNRTIHMCGYGENTIYHLILNQ